MRFSVWLEFTQNNEQISLIKNDIVKLLAGAGTSPGDALKINLAKKTKGSNNGVKGGAKAVESILADNNIFQRLNQIDPQIESKLRQSLQRAKPDYYELGTLLKDTFGEDQLDINKPKEKPKVPAMPPKDDGSKFPKPQQQLPPPAGMPSPVNPSMVPGNNAPLY